MQIITTEVCRDSPALCQRRFSTRGCAGRECCQCMQQDQTVLEQLITTVAMQTNCILGKRQRFLVWVILFSTLTVGRCARKVVLTFKKSDIVSLVRLVINTNLIPPYLFFLIFSFHPPLHVDLTPSSSSKLNDLRGRLLLDWEGRGGAGV